MERLAEIYAKSQHIRDAVLEAQQALKIEPDNVDAHRLLARIYVRTLGDIERGRRAAGKSGESRRAIPGDFEDCSRTIRIPRLWLARLYRFENQHDEAEKVLRGILQHDPDNGQALEQLSQILVDEGRSQEAIDAADASRRRFFFARYVRPAGRRLLASEGLSRRPKSAYRKAVERGSR